MITSPEERVSQSFGEREGICVESSCMRSRVGSIRADKNLVSSETPKVEEEADGRAGNCPNKAGGRGASQGHGPGLGMRGLSELEKSLWEGIVHLATWCL